MYFNTKRKIKESNVNLANVFLCLETQKQTVTEPGLWKDLRTKVQQTVNLKLHQYMDKPCDLESTQFCDKIREILYAKLFA